MQAKWALLASEALREWRPARVTYSVSRRDQRTNSNVTKCSLLFRKIRPVVLSVCPVGASFLFREINQKPAQRPYCRAGLSPPLSAVRRLRAPLAPARGIGAQSSPSSNSTGVACQRLVSMVIYSPLISSPFRGRYE